MALAVGKIDEIIKDYLLYRGLVSTARQLDIELKNEKEKKFRVDKIMDTLHAHINNHDLASLREYWQFLEQRLFSRLEQTYAPSTRKLETSLLKLYVVNAIQSNKNDKVTEFFEKMTTELQGQTEWREWFMLPFIRNPEENRHYAMYFSRQWQDTTFLTLHNFLSVIIRSMVLPSAFEYDEEARKVSKLRDENNKLRQMLSDYKEQKIFPSTTHEDSLVSTPVGPPPGPSSLDLMEDFSVISQDIPAIQKPPANPPRTQQIKSFIKNIGLPSSPIMGRKTPPIVKNAPAANKNNTLGATNKASTMPVAVSATGNSTQATGKKEDKPKPKVVDVQNKTKSKTGFVVGNPQPPSTIACAVGRTNGGEKPKLQGAEADGMPAEAPDALDQSDLTPVGDLIEDDENPLILLNQEEYTEHRSCITHCRFNHTGQKIATADVDGVVKVWGLQPSPVTEATTMSKSAVLSLDWTRSDRLLLGSKGGLVKLYDVKEKKTIKEAVMEASYPRVISLACNPQGTNFVCSTVGRSRPPVAATSTDSGSQRIGRLAIWDLRSMKVERTLPVSPNSVAVNWTSYNHNGQMVITGASDGHIRLFDTRKGDCLSSWTAHNGEVYSVVFSPDETTCYSMGADGKFVKWSIHKTGHLISSLPIHQGACGPFVFTGHGGYRQVQTPKGKLFALEPEGNHVLTCAQNGGQIYNLSAEATVKRNLFLGGHRTPVVAVDWSPANDSRVCVTGSMDGRLRVSTLLAQ